MDRRQERNAYAQPWDHTGDDGHSPLSPLGAIPASARASSSAAYPNGSPSIQPQATAQPPTRNGDNAWAQTYRQPQPPVSQNTQDYPWVQAGWQPAPPPQAAPPTPAQTYREPAPGWTVYPPQAGAQPVFNWTQNYWQPPQAYQPPTYPQQANRAAYPVQNAPYGQPYSPQPVFSWTQNYWQPPQPAPAGQPPQPAPAEQPAMDVQTQRYQLPGQPPAEAQWNRASAQTQRYQLPRPQYPYGGPQPGGNASTPYPPVRPASDYAGTPAAWPPPQVQPVRRQEVPYGWQPVPGQTIRYQPVERPAAPATSPYAATGRTHIEWQPVAGQTIAYQPVREGTRPKPQAAAPSQMERTGRAPVFPGQKEEPGLKPSAPLHSFPIEQKPFGSSPAIAPRPAAGEGKPLFPRPTASAFNTAKETPTALRPQAVRPARDTFTAPLSAPQPVASPLKGLPNLKPLYPAVPETTAYAQPYAPSPIVPQARYQAPGMQPAPTFAQGNRSNPALGGTSVKTAAEPGETAYRPTIPAVPNMPPKSGIKRDVPPIQPSLTATQPPAPFAEPFSVPPTSPESFTPVRPPASAGPAQATPTGQATPVKPNVPIVPFIPTEQASPVKPNAPVAPFTPTEQASLVKPNATITPFSPSEQASPVKPNAPVTPIAPFTPTEQVTPVKPNTPVVPVSPSVPTVQASPVTPLKPAMSAAFMPSFDSPDQPDRVVAIRPEPQPPAIPQAEPVPEPALTNAMPRSRRTEEHNSEPPSGSTQLPANQPAKAEPPQAKAFDGATSARWAVKLAPIDLQASDTPGAHPPRERRVQAHAMPITAQDGSPVRATVTKVIHVEREEHETAATEASRELAARYHTPQTAPIQTGLPEEPAPEAQPASRLPKPEPPLVRETSAAKRRGIGNRRLRWVIMAVVVVALVMALVQSGLWANLMAIFAPRSVTVDGSQSVAEQQQAAQDAASQTTAVLISATVTPAEATAPVTLTFQIATNTLTSSVRLKDDSGETLQTTLSSAPQNDGLLWQVTATLDKPYTGNIHIFLRDQAGVWSQTDFTCAVTVH